MRNITGAARWLVAVGLLIAWGGCGSARHQLFVEPGQPIVWPEPPEQAHIRYIGELTGEDDLKRQVSGMEAFGQLIFGRKEVGVLRSPRGLAIDDQDRLFIADGAAAAIHMMDLQTRKYLQFSKLAGSETLQSPVDVVVVDDSVYVSDSALGKICVFDTSGAFKFAFGDEVLERPSGIAYGAVQQKLFVVDTKRHQVDIFGPQGKHAGTLGDRGPTAFRFPTFVWVDRQGRTYVSDTLGYRVQIFDADGRFVRTLGEHGNRPGYFAHPSGVAVDSGGNIYVVDKQFENIQIFNSEGQILMALGHEGNGPGEFWLPMGLFIDNRDRIYVADSFNKRIQIFQLLETQTP